MSNHHGRHLVSLAVVTVVFFVFGLQAFALTPKEIYQKVSPGVVFIFAPEGFARKGSSKPLSDISVYLKPEKVTGNQRGDLSRRYKGTILAYDLPLDLALLKIMEVDVPLTTVSFGDSDRVVIGDQAYAIGHPEQGGLWSLTTGVISAQRQNFAGLIGKDLFQTEASINRGNSGGPLLDELGIMIGINSMIARRAEDGMAITDVNFSIKSNVALKWLNKLGHRISSVVEDRSETEKEVVTVPPKPKDKQKQRPGKLEGKGEKPREGEILTEKNPYRINELVAAMREMEELMDEMRGRIEEYRKRR
jgi:serine protease Do